MKLEYHNPTNLKPNPWNPNHLSSEDESRLEASMLRYDGLFKPIIVRELDNGDLEILGGQHRCHIAIRLSLISIPVINLGKIDDTRAKEISIIDNGRYGQDDAAQLSELLTELGSPTELAAFMPFDVSDIDHVMSAVAIDLDKLDLKIDEDDGIIEPAPPKSVKTHSIIRQKIPIPDQSLLESSIKRIIEDQGFDDSDSMINAGDALMWLIRYWINSEQEHGA